MKNKIILLLATFLILIGGFLMFSNYDADSSLGDLVGLIFMVVAWIVLLFAFISVFVYVFLIFKMVFDKKRIFSANILKGMKSGVITGVLFAALSFYPYRIFVTNQVAEVVESSDKTLGTILFFIAPCLVFSLFGYFYGKGKDRKLKDFS